MIDLLIIKRQVPFFRLWSGEVNNMAKPSSKGFIAGMLHGGCKNRQTMVRLHPLQEVIDHSIGVPIMAVLNFAPATKQRISLIEEENRLSILGCVEYPS